MTMNSKGIVELSAHEMARSIRARKFSCLELVEAHLVQIERLNPVLNAYVQVRPEEVPPDAQSHGGRDREEVRLEAAGYPPSGRGAPELKRTSTESAA